MPGAAIGNYPVVFKSALITNGQAPITTGQVLVYDQVTEKWRPEDVGSGGDYLPLTGGDLTGPLTIASTRAAFTEDGSLYFRSLGGAAPFNNKAFIDASDGTAHFAGGFIKLEVDGSITASGEIAYVNPSLGGKANVFGIYNSGDSTKTFPALQMDSNGNIRLGGTIPASPNISLNANGNVIAAGSITSGVTGTGVNIYPDGTIQSWNNGNLNFNAAADGSATFLGGVSAGNNRIRIGPADSTICDPFNNVGIKIGSDSLTTCDADGKSTTGTYDLGDTTSKFRDGYFSGSITAGSANPLDGSGFGAIIRPDSSYSAYPETNSNSNVISITPRNIGTTTVALRADGTATFTGTVTANGTVLTRANGTLDVGERLENVLARMDAMEANEITDDATDSALLTLIAALSTRLDERDSAIAALTTRIAQLELPGTPTPEPTPEPVPHNLIPDTWSQEQRMAAMSELIQEYQANRD